uniref:Retrotransposon gag domain-containing protein n=1 Tax=Chenopodium quinoa TaxID=63459 RepID=A0A803MIC7_CHEQI
MGERILKQLAAPKTGEDLFCIVFLELEKPLKLNSGFLNLLPKYYGNAGENPYRHLKKFKVVCSSMNPEGIKQEHIRLHSFPFSLHGHAKVWLYDLPASSIVSLAKIEVTFLEKFFPTSCIGSIRKEICGIRQNNNESLYEYWQRFNRLCSSYPQHQISDQLLIQYFYEGLLPHDRGMIDAFSGGALVDNTSTKAKTLISNMAQNTQQFSTKNDIKKVNEPNFTVVNSQLKENAQQIFALTTIVSRIVPVNESKARVCGVCYDISHTSDNCPDLQCKDVNALDRLPSQTLPNPNEYAKASVILRSGKELKESRINSREAEREIEVRPKVVVGESEENMIKRVRKNL